MNELTPPQPRVIGLVVFAPTAGIALADAEPDRTGTAGAPTATETASGTMTRTDLAALAQRTVDRLRQCEQLDEIVVLHEPTAVVAVTGARSVAMDFGADEPLHRKLLAARKWSPTAWRGGLGGATIYDELLRPHAMAAALRESGATAALLVGADWAAVDADLCDQVIARHRENPPQFAMTFTQAPPGVCGCVMGLPLLEKMAAGGTSIGKMLDYNPRVPQPDPIARDVCVQIPAEVRQQRIRAIADLPRWRGITTASETLNGPLASSDPDACEQLPQQITVELTPERPCTGPLTWQHHVALERSPMAMDQLTALLAPLAEAGDVAITFGGAGDALRHPQWPEAIRIAREAGAWGVAVATDLHVEPEVLERLVELGNAGDLDAVIVHLNADSAATYAKLMGVDAFDAVLSRIEWLLNHRRNGLPWIVPRMIKTVDNVTELEPFVDRWTHFCGQAVVVGPDGPLEDRAVIDMAPPGRVACRQLSHRMTILSNGRAALCDQDFAGNQAFALNGEQPLRDGWRRLRAMFDGHRRGEFEANPLCAKCRQWHRP